MWAEENENKIHSSVQSMSSVRFQMDGNDNEIFNKHAKVHVKIN